MGLSTATYTFRQCVPRCRISAEFYEIRAGERACFSSDILDVFWVWFLYGLASSWSTAIWSFTFPNPFSTHFLRLHSIFGISIDPRHPFPGLSVLAYASRIPSLQTPGSWIIASILLHPLSGNTWLLLFIIVIYDRLGVAHGTRGQFTNDSSFPFRTFLEHYLLFPGSGVSDRLIRSAWYSFCEGILACILSLFLLLPSDLCFSLFFLFYIMNQLFLRVEDTGLSLGELHPVTIQHSLVGHWWPIQLCAINPEQSCLSSTYLCLFSLLFPFWLLGCVVELASSVHLSHLWNYASILS